MEHFIKLERICKEDWFKKLFQNLPGGNLFLLEYRNLTPNDRFKLRAQWYQNFEVCLVVL